MGERLAFCCFCDSQIGTPSRACPFRPVCPFQYFAVDARAHIRQLPPLDPSQPRLRHTRLDSIHRPLPRLCVRIPFANPIDHRAIYPPIYHPFPRRPHHPIDPTTDISIPHLPLNPQSDRRAWVKPNITRFITGVPCPHTLGGLVTRRVEEHGGGDVDVGEELGVDCKGVCVCQRTGEKEDGRVPTGKGRSTLDAVGRASFDNAVDDFAFEGAENYEAELDWEGGTVLAAFRRGFVGGWWKGRGG